MIDHGLPPETPALLAEAAGTPQQRLARTSVAGLAALLDAEGPSPNPALILYGPLARTD